MTEESESQTISLSAKIGPSNAALVAQVHGVSGYLGGGRQLAVVVTFGYAAFLAGPVILGWLVHTFGVQKAMLLPFAMSFGLVVVVRWIPNIERGSPVEDVCQR